MKISVIATSHKGYEASKEEFDSLSGLSARMCYSVKPAEDVFNEPVEVGLTRAQDAKERVHHSVFGHPHIQFAFEGIPKGLAMVLNNEGIYNTSERSARYKKMVMPDNEAKLYYKWLDIFKCAIREEYLKKYPKFFTDAKIETLAQENARYLISVFTPVSMTYTVSYQQLNYLYQMMKNEIANPDSNAFMKGLKPAMQDFCNALEKTNYIDYEIANGVNIKNRKLSLIGSMISPEQYFGDVYSVSYQGTLAQLAQAHRHRTTDYNMTLLDEPKYYVPQIIRPSDELTRQWIRDCERLSERIPQGTLVNINEMGTLDWFIQKMKERKCTYAQLEINQQTDAILNQYIKELRAKNHPRTEELAKYSHGSRCTFPDFKCPDPCGFPEGVNGTRII